MDADKQCRLQLKNTLYDIFAESTDRRVIIEIQTSGLRFNFDHFLNYFIMAIVELQRSSKDHGIEKTVYAIIFITAPYKINEKFRKMQSEMRLQKEN